MTLNRKLLLELVAGPDSLILRYWDSDKGSLEASLAVAIRSFMRSRRILDAREAVRLFFALNPDRLAVLASLFGCARSAHDRLAA